MAHHGSLDRRHREEAEEVMKQNPVAVCVATSTLEFGIDIGDIDLVVLVEPPWSLESLQQRVGRGSRRSGTIQAAAIYQTEEERSVLELMFEAAQTGSYRSGVYRPDLSVVVQQTLSLLYQFRAGLSRHEYLHLVGLLGAEGDITAVLRYLKDKGYCLELGDALYPSSDLLDIGDEGNIHSNVPDNNEYRVVDSDTGRQIGRIRGSFDEVFLLAGQSWRVIAVRGDEILAKRTPQRASAAQFGVQRNVGRFHYLLPPDLRDVRLSDH
jgi:ATP-dependent Lhr-like helicase